LDFDLDAFHAGDDAFFGELVRTYSPRLLPHLRRHADTSTDAQDMLQDVWLHAYAKRRSFSGRGSLYGWLLAICRTTGLNAVRKRGRRPVTEELHDIAADGGSDGGLRDALIDAVMALPERQRDVVLLRLVEGMSTADTARILRCAEGTVKATLHQANRKLREQLEETLR